jgi:hypothetical protein
MFPFRIRFFLEAGIYSIKQALIFTKWKKEIQKSIFIQGMSQDF